MGGVAAVIVAGGTGQRSGLLGGKQLALVAGRPVLAWTVSAVDASPEVDSIVVVCHAERVDEYREIIEALGLRAPVQFAAGGATRQASVASGLAAVDDSVETIVVHDGARPLVTAELIGATLAALDADPQAAGIVVGHPAVDTLKLVEGREITGTPERARYWAVQTPQVFRAPVLRAAYESARAEGFAGTDDASLVERYGSRVLVFEGPRDNIKVTVAEDLLFVEAALAYREDTGQ